MLETKLKQTLLIDPAQILRKALKNEEVQSFILRSNRETLYNKGEDSEGESLGEYSPFTVELKKQKGQPFDRITLFDSGDFYRSFKLFIGSNYIEIQSDPVKEDGTDLLVEFGEDVLGLQEDQLDKLRDMLIPVMIKITKNETGITS